MTSQAPPLVLLLVFMSTGCAERGVTHATDIPTLHYPEGLSVVTRDAWGWEDGHRALEQHVINRITIHHGGEDFPTTKDPIDYLQHLQSWSRTEKNWTDIPYHFMIDLRGTIYEARPVNLPGDTNTGYDTRGHALICVMGNYENQIISPGQLNALISLTAFLAKTFDVAVDSIKGHKDYTETLCPGKYLRDGTIARGVREILKK